MCCELCVVLELYVETGFEQIYGAVWMSLEHHDDIVWRNWEHSLRTVPGVIAWNYDRSSEEHSLQSVLGVEAWTYTRSLVENKSLRIECVYVRFLLICQVEDLQFSIHFEWVQGSEHCLRTGPWDPNYSVLRLEHKSDFQTFFLRDLLTVDFLETN